MFPSLVWIPESKKENKICFFVVVFFFIPQAFQFILVFEVIYPEL